MSTLWKLRLKVSGMSVTIFDSMMRPVSVRSVCSSGDSATTLTASRHLADLELHVHADGRVDVHLDARTHDLSESLHLRLDDIRTVQEAGKRVDPDLVGGRGSLDVGLSFRGRHGRAGDGGTAGIGDRAEQRAGHGLSACGGWNENEQARDHGRRDNRVAVQPVQATSATASCVLLSRDEHSTIRAG